MKRLTLGRAILLLGFLAATHLAVYGAPDDQSIELYKEIISADPGDIEAQYGLALTYDKLGKDDQAVEAYRRVIRSEPEGPRAYEAYINLGGLYAHRGQYPEAIEAFKKAIRLEPEGTTGHYNLGVAYFTRGKRDLTMKEYRFIKYRDKKLADALYGLMHGEKVAGVRRWSRPADAGAYLHLALSYTEAGRNQEAIEALKNAIRIEPNHAEAHYALGLAYLTVGDRGSALAEHKRLKELDPHLADELMDYIDKQSSKN